MKNVKAKLNTTDSLGSGTAESVGLVTITLGTLMLPGLRLVCGKRVSSGTVAAIQVITPEYAVFRDHVDSCRRSLHTQTYNTL